MPERTTAFSHLATLLAFAALAQGCASPEKIADPGCDTETCQVLHVYVADQSLEYDPITIDVFLDDIHVITGSFGYGEGHDWYRFDFDLSDGVHELRATSPDHPSSASRELHLTRERWAVIGFYDSGTGPDGAPVAASFGLDVLDEEPAFY